MITLQSLVISPDPWPAIHELKLWETGFGRDRPLTPMTDRLIQTAFDALLARMKPSSVIWSSFSIICEP